MNTPDSAAGYAFWTAPDGSAKVVYSLSALGEIDAIVNDGYRRIPHGGIETGGILFGTRDGRTLRIEAFRQIACEHAFGPSFVLSEADLGRLREQLQTASSDPELAGFTPLGWFVGHTRNALLLNERETAWFQEFFPEPGSLTLLVKPERFQPTRFAFFLRNELGSLEAGGTVILPLSTQSSNAVNTPAPAIPAPAAVRPKPSTAEPESEPQSPIDAVDVQTEQEQPAPAPPIPTPQPRSAPASLPKPIYKKEPSDSTQTELATPYATLPRSRARQETGGGFSGFGVQSIAVLLLAAILGCAAGYWAYLQLPSPMIPVSVREQNTQIIVEWPADQTDKVGYAALQVNDGPWQILSPAQKSAGRAVITAPSGDLRIELLAKHWLRDSRGIVRYLRTPKTRVQRPAKLGVST